MMELTEEQKQKVYQAGSVNSTSAHLAGLLEIQEHEAYQLIHDSSNEAYFIFHKAKAENRQAEYNALLELAKNGNSYAAKTLEKIKSEHSSEDAIRSFCGL